VKKYYKDEGKHCYCDGGQGMNKYDCVRERQLNESFMVFCLSTLLF